MDEQTDALVQETLFRELEGRTLLTIAHRLDTILDYDRILVLDQGTVKVSMKLVTCSGNIWTSVDIVLFLFSHKCIQIHSICVRAGTV